MANKNLSVNSEAMAADAGAPSSQAVPWGGSDRPLSLGMAVNVVVAAGVVLINNETGTAFVPGEPTPQTVTPTLLRRRADGDLSVLP